MHPMELLGDVVHRRLRNHFGHYRLYSEVIRLKWKLILVYLQIVLFDARYAHGLRRTYHSLKIHFVHIRFKTVLVSVQDRCTVCAKCTIG
jgi:hypothetical protein